MKGAYSLSAADAARAIRDGELTSEELVKSCLARIAEFEPAVQAWQHLDEELALEQARACDKRRYEGKATGPLNGVPVGIKDIIDTHDYPTEYGSPIHAGRRTIGDSHAVARLREAGAVILGKTVTTEFAVYAPGKTTNPHDASRTPGGSSSGSAAAVASLMVPAALGTQTNGSCIRPASFCGVVGYKPSFGMVSRSGMLTQSPPLDQPGVFTRSVADAALMADAVIGYDVEDGYMLPEAKPGLAAAAVSEPPLEPRVAFMKTPAWDQAEEGTRAAFAELTEFLGDRVEEVPLDEVYDEVFEWHRRVMEADLAKNFARDFQRAPEQISPQLTEMIERGQKVLAVDYNLGIERMSLFEHGLDPVFENFDAIITPATPGEAPVGLDATGSPVFCTLWTFTGLPAITLPLMSGEAGMPLGVQLVGKKGDDARLLRTATWLTKRIDDAAE
ncbi:MAG: amidase [Rhodospirillales bacterium]|nr:amidase [Rhodospirillales bacterium]MBO6787183.1 amidase [Rhodospirillales bacterium]